MADTSFAAKLRKKRNRPPPSEPWVWFSRVFLESEAWRTAPINTRRFVERVMIEHMHHAGTENGNLIVTFKQLAEFGIHGRHRHKAVEDAINRGLIDRPVKGKASAGQNRHPSRYALGWLPWHDGSAARNRWKSWKPKSPKRKSEDRRPNQCCEAYLNAIH
jgi:hypothetical protein